MRTPAARLPKMMIGFLVRRCTVALGHPPSAAEFAAWANAGQMNLFGRPISESDARIMLRHQARIVTARGAAPHEQYVDDDAALAGAAANVIRLADARARRGAR